MIGSLQTFVLEEDLHVCVSIHMQSGQRWNVSQRAEKRVHAKPVWLSPQPVTNKQSGYTAGGHSESTLQNLHAKKKKTLVHNTQSLIQTKKNIDTTQISLVLCTVTNYKLQKNNSRYSGNIWSILQPTSRGGMFCLMFLELRGQSICYIHQCI